MELEVGQIVKLKTLAQVMKVQNVTHWKHIANPVLNSKGMMNKLFGTKVQIEYAARNSSTFSAFNPEDNENVWSFNKKWIENCGFEMEMLQGELFEI